MECLIERTNNPVFLVALRLVVRDAANWKSRLAEACLITPPVGLNVFVLAGIVDSRLEEIFNGVLWFTPRSSSC